MQIRHAILLAALVATGSVYAKRVNIMNYDSLVNELQNGNDVKAIIYLDGCRSKDGKTPQGASGAVGRVNFNVFVNYKVLDEGKERIAAATSTTTLTEHRSFGAVYGFTRLRVFSDNSAEFHTSYYDPKTFEQKSTSDWICHVDGSNGSVRLFSDRSE